MVVVLLVTNVVQLSLLFIQWLHRTGRQLVQMFPIFTLVQRRQQLLSLHRQQSDAGLQSETGLLPSYTLVTFESYTVVTVASWLKNFLTLNFRHLLKQPARFLNDENFPLYGSIIISNWLLVHHAPSLSITRRFYCKKGHNVIQLCA